MGSVRNRSIRYRGAKNQCARNLAQVLGVNPVAADCCGLSCEDEEILIPFSHLWEKVARSDG
jgi:hypothetical protein